MSPTRGKVLVGLGVWLGGTVVLYLVFGKGQKHPNYAPQDEFKLHTYVNLGILSITQAVIYVFLAGILTCATVIYVARRMKQRPNRVQTLVEVIFHGLQTNIVGANMDRRMAARWFPFVATLALFIFYSNVVGYLPLPTNTSEYVSIFGWHIPPLLALRSDGQPLDPTRARDRGVRLLHRRGCPRKGADRVPEGAHSGRSQRANYGGHLRP